MRIAGPGTGHVLQALLRDPPTTARVLTPVRLQSPPLPALLLRFAAPHSYTGEDAAELQVPGNAALLDRLLHQAVGAEDVDVRLAEPGEFTFRAYTAGKLDLTQAEGVAATINATSDSQLRAASLLRRGRLGDAANGLVETLGTLLALVEAGIDFTDQEDVVPIAPRELDNRLADAQARLEHVLTHSRPWGAIESLPRVVLVGPPSAGKSTLFNALLRRERAVIDPAPGTTRDAIAEPLRLTDSRGQAAEVMLVDIAGLDDPTTALDRAAQEAAANAIRHADLLLLVQDKANTDVSPPISDAPTLHLRTKADLATDAPQTDEPGSLRVSAKTGLGLDALRAAIAQAMRDRSVSIASDLLALQPRHEKSLRAALQHITSTRSQLDHAPADRLPEIELLADGLRAALDTLAALGGRLTPDEVIGRVFATFCVGK